MVIAWPHSEQLHYDLLREFIHAINQAPSLPPTPLILRLRPLQHPHNFPQAHPAPRNLRLHS
jgi:hypothetical protein